MAILKSPVQEPGVSGKYVPGSGPVNAKIMVVGEAPGAEEDSKGETLVGPTGRLTDEILKEAGLKFGLKEVYKTNVIKVRPPMNQIKLLPMLGRKIEDFIPQLWGEVEEIKPNVILALGNVALEALTGERGISKWRGSILKSVKFTTKVIPTYHPANLLRQRGPGSLPYSARAYITLDFKRAIEESTGTKFNLPQRLLQVCRSSKQLFDFIRMYRSQGKRLVSVDIESHKCIPTCVGLAFNSYHALSVPLFNLYGNRFISDAELNDVWLQLAELLEDPEIEIIGQNFKYDHQKLLRPIGIRCRNIHADTSILAHTVNPEFPKSLAFLTSIYTREPYYKDDGKDFDPKKDAGDKIYIYNARDAAVTYEVFEALLKDAEEYGLTDFFYSHQMPLHDLYMHVESVGFPVDIEFRAALTEKYKKRLLEEMEEVFSMVGRKFKYNHPATVAKILYTDLKIPERADTKEDTLVALLANNVKDPDKRRIIELILSLRRVHKTLSTYLMQPLDGDGRVRTSYQICGTETGRTSTKILAPPVRPFKCGLAFQTLTKHGDIGQELRAILLAPEGHVIMEADLSQAEARIVALLADDNETLKLFDTTDIHKMTAGWCFGLKPDEALKLDKEDPRRFVGKTVRHAGNYGMGKRRLMLEIMTGAKRANINLTISEKEAGHILDTFHRKTPKIRQVFHAEVFSAIRRTRTLVNPYGRQRRFFARFDDELLKEAYATLPQSTVRDHVARAMLDFRKLEPQISIVSESHDAFAVFVPVGRVPEIGRRIKDLLERPIDFSRCTIKRGLLKIPADIQTGPNYRDLRKVAV